MQVIFKALRWLYEILKESFPHRIKFKFIENQPVRINDLETALVCDKEFSCFFFFVIEVSISYRNSASYFLKVLCNLVIKNITKCYYLVLDINMIMWHISLQFS